MQQHKLFQEYLEKVCEQIRWKKAHPTISKELGDHLEDKYTALMENGSQEDIAVSEAVRDMGDALLVGTQLDRAYRPRPAWGVIAITTVLMLVGYFARDYVIRYTNSITNVNQHSEDVTQSLFFLCTAIVALIVGCFLDYTILGKHPLIVGIGSTSIIIIIVGLFSFLGIHGINGMPFGVYHFARYLVALIPVVYAVILWWWPYRGYMGLIFCYLVIAVICFAWISLPVFLAFFYCAVCGIMLTVEMLKGKFAVKKIHALLILYVPVVLFLFWLFYGSPREFIIMRLGHIFDPWADPTGPGFMGVQIQLTLAGAQWIGTGSHTIEHVPGLVDDLMLTFYIHKLGWIALAIVLFLFGILFMVSIFILKKQKSKLGRMVAAAVLSSLGIQSVIYLVSNLFGWVLMSPFPLISNSNAALIVNAFLIGLMLSVFRTNDVVSDAAIEPKFIPRFKIAFERLR